MLAVHDGDYSRPISVFQNIPLSSAVLQSQGQPCEVSLTEGLEKASQATC